MIDVLKLKLRFATDVLRGQGADGVCLFYWLEKACSA